ncbi:MAG: response regulator [Thioalkalispiraceae bacterium]|jgi:CheY-like chemotaxis protein
MPDKKTIIYIEDNPTNLKLVEQLIKRKGDLDFLSATEPHRGIELITEHLPDLILLDINLPDMNGFEILEILRNQDNTAAIPVIAVSANAMPSDLEKGMAAGFNAYITKPINISDFYKQVEQFLA